MSAREFVGGVLRFQLRLAAVVVRALRTAPAAKTVYLTPPSEPCPRCAERTAAWADEATETELGRRFVESLKADSEASLGRAVARADRGERDGASAGRPVALRSKKAVKRGHSVSHSSDKVGKV